MERRRRFDKAREELENRQCVQLFRDCYDISYLEEEILVDGAVTEMIGLEVCTGTHILLFPIENHLEGTIKYLMDLEVYF